MEQAEITDYERAGLGLAIYIALGANQQVMFEGRALSPEQTFARVINRLSKSGVETFAKSSIWKSPAWPDPEAQPAYKNAVVCIETSLKPLELLTILKVTEQEFGRVVGARNAPRPLDLDIIDYRGEMLQTDMLTLPHPRMLSRAFVLFPLWEIAPNWHDPQKNRTIHDWIARLPLNDVEPLTRLGRFI